MSKKEEVKSNIETLRALILSFLAAIFGVCGYAFVDRKTLEMAEFGFLALIMIFLCVIVFVLGFLYNKERKKLRGL